MFTRLVTLALFAGFLTGIAAAILQLWLVQPLLLHAELYESGALTHFGSGGAANPAHHPWPGIDPVRDGLSVLFTALIYTGYAFVLAAAMALAAERGHALDARRGVIWGVAGFVAFQMAPAMGLPPEMPGAAAADVAERQVWWWGTVAATGAGLACIAFGRSSVPLVAGIVLLALPHMVGAPEPESFAGPTPPELSAHFGARALGVGLAAWALLGALTAFFLERDA